MLFIHLKSNVMLWNVPIVTYIIDAIYSHFLRGLYFSLLLEYSTKSTQFYTEHAVDCTKQTFPWFSNEHC